MPRFLIEVAELVKLIEVSPGMGQRDRAVAKAFEEWGGAPPKNTEVKVTELPEPVLYFVKQNDWTLEKMGV